MSVAKKSENAVGSAGDSFYWSTLGESCLNVWTDNFAKGSRVYCPGDYITAYFTLHFYQREANNKKTSWFTRTYSRKQSFWVSPAVIHNHLICSSTYNSSPAVFNQYVLEPWIEVTFGKFELKVKEVRLHHGLTLKWFDCIKTVEMAEKVLIFKPSNTNTLPTLTVLTVHPHFWPEEVLPCFELFIYVSDIVY